MGFYLVQASYSPETVRAMIKRPHDREKAVRAAIKRLGGKVHSFFFSFGDYDAVVIAEMPDNVTKAAAALGSVAGGAISRSHTTTLLTADEAMEAMKLAKKYKPPPQ